MIFFIILHREQITRCLTIKIRIVMKKIMMTLVAMLTIAASGKAMSYEQARNEALFLTDKMAYELNLTDEQYEAAYEINLDYLMGVTSYDDVFGTYWERRNLDLSYILLDWQWEAFRAATYFFRPLYWEAGYWHFGIYARYPHRDYFFFGRPVFYASYRGGHAWHRHGTHGYYHGHRDHYRGHSGHSHFGMLDRWNRGDYRHHDHHGRSDMGHHRDGGHRNSSTRTTVHDRRHNNGGGSYGGYRDHNSTKGDTRPTTGTRPSGDTRPSGGTRPTTSTRHALPDRTTTSSRPERSSTFSRADRATMSSRPERSTSTRPSMSSDRPRSSSSSSSFGNSRSSSHSSGSFSRSSGGSSHSSGSFSRGGGGGSHSSGSHSGGGRSAGGGRSFGGHR
jgi:hypothetical protein